MIEVFNLDGLPVYKYRTEKNHKFDISQLKTKSLPQGVYFVRAVTKAGTKISKILIF